MRELAIRDSSILIVDDEPANLRFLSRLLERDGYRVIHTATRPEDGLEIFARELVDIVLLDLNMPGMNGFEVMQRLESLTVAGDYVPVLMLTGNSSQETRKKALAGGARDFLSKPFDPAEALLRIRNLLDMRHLQRALARQNETLEARVRERTQALESAQLEILSRLALVAEYYDNDTSDHTRRVAELSKKVALELGMPEHQAELLGQAAVLHDVGKIAVPPSLTRKEGPLSRPEREVVQRHPQAGARVLGGSSLPLLQVAEEVARTHHERWDGRGYPEGLRGEEIPLSGRIVSVADVFDALTNVRPYKPAWPREKALEEMRANAGTQFDRRVVAALERVLAREAGRRAPGRAAVGGGGRQPAPAEVAPARRATAIGNRVRAWLSRLREAPARMPAAVAVLLALTAAAVDGQTPRGEATARAIVTIPAAARVVGVDARPVAAEADDELGEVEFEVRVRANGAYRLMIAVPPDALGGVRVRVPEGGGERTLRPGESVRLLRALTGPGEHRHRVRVQPAAASGAPPVVFSAAPYSRP